MTTPSSDEIRPDALVLANIVQVDISWALAGSSGATSPN